jgi:hypothetical protein
MVKKMTTLLLVTLAAVLGILSITATTVPEKPKGSCKVGDSIDSTVETPRECKNMGGEWDAGTH